MREADACFIGGRSQAERREHSVRAKAIAREMSKTIKTYAMCTVVHGETDAQAEDAVRRYDEAADVGALANMLRSWGVATWGRYVDRIVREGDQWRIAHRTVFVDGNIPRPQTPQT